MASTIWTIGHSTKPIDEFVAILQAHRIRRLIDVRTIPRSRHNPQFNTGALAKNLAGAAISYQHSAILGGLRKPMKDSINGGWRNASFRGYADYMQTDKFWAALDKLIADSRQRKTVIMCAEAVPWRCHRSLIADALAFKGWKVLHIMSERKADPHRLTSFAEIQQDRLIYPAPPDPDGTRRLF